MKRKKFSEALFAATTAALTKIGYEPEPYVVSPAGLGVLCLRMSADISAYVNVSYYEKYHSIGLSVGFGFPLLKQVSDECLTAVGSKHGINPVWSTFMPCPAILFSVECFVGQCDGAPLEINERTSERMKSLVHDGIIAGSYSGVDSTSTLCRFLSNDVPPFSWAVSGVPRRLAHVAYLMKSLNIPIDQARKELSGTNQYVQGDGDFYSYSGDLTEEVLRHFYKYH